MRGPLTEGLGYPSPLRITPAYAGTTSTMPLTSVIVRDHPRLCGDHHDHPCVTQPKRGSPPLMRGPPADYQSEGADSGITPAYAGTTVSTSPLLFRWLDHPRLCGDHILSTVGFIGGLGSPPLMRGPLLRLIQVPRTVRITPAYAGTTRIMTLRLPNLWDHPRLCGDHNHGRGLRRGQLGSPPLMRGPRSCQCLY